MSGQHEFLTKFRPVKELPKRFLSVSCMYIMDHYPGALYIVVKTTAINHNSTLGVTNFFKPTYDRRFKWMTKGNSILVFPTSDPKEALVQLVDVYLRQ